MRRLRRIPVRVSAAVAVILCVTVAILAATGVFSSGTHRGTLPAGERFHLVRARIAARHSVARLLAVTAAERRTQMCGRGHVATGKLPRESYRRAVRVAEKYLGVKYLWGGASPSGFDTSGLVMYVYGKLGVSLPHYTVAQYCYRHAIHPPRSKLQPGDLIFFYDRSHVGIYVGNNQFIHAPHTGAVVRIESLSGVYSREYYGALRILPQAA
jgi:cell wall-associated NlpC family hydrolase